MPSCLFIEYVNRGSSRTDSAAVCGTFDLFGLASRGFGNVLLDVTGPLQRLMLRLENAAFGIVAHVVGARAEQQCCKNRNDQLNSWFHDRLQTHLRSDHDCGFCPLDSLSATGSGAISGNSSPSFFARWVHLSRAALRRSSVASLSSTISMPSSVSRTSSMVTTPERPPYSSTTTAKCSCSARSWLKSTLSEMNSGTKSTSRFRSLRRTSGFPRARLSMMSALST